MAQTSEAPRNAQKSHTYYPEEDSRQELLDFAELIRELEEYLAQGMTKAALVDPQGTHRPIPDEVFQILEQVTNAMASGKGITVIPRGMAMTTQQAAEFLSISRPTLVRLLEAGEIPYDQPGRHRRVRLEDLVEYQERSRDERRKALNELRKTSLDSKIKVGNPTSLKRRSGENS